MATKNTPTWKTKDGREILISQMDDGHLANTIRYLERAHKLVIRRVCADPPCFQGDMAQIAADQEFNALLNSEPGDLWPVYENLLIEQQRRQKR